MRYGWKLTAALGFVGAVAVAATAFAQSGSAPATSPAPSGSEVQRPRLERRLERMKQRRHRMGARRRMVHGEFKVELREGGFATVKVDVGEVTAVDAGDKTITIKRRDGETLTFTATDDTRVRRDGEKAALSDVEVGDRARIVQIDKGDGFVLKLIGAHEPDASTT